MPRSTFRELFRDASATEEFLTQGAILEFTEELVRRMKEQGVRRNKMASLIGASPAYVTKILRGNANFTLGSMVKLARAVDSVLRLHLAPIGSKSFWYDTPSHEESRSQIETFHPNLKPINVPSSSVLPPLPRPHMEMVRWGHDA